MEYRLCVLLVPLIALFTAAVVDLGIYAPRSKEILLLVFAVVVALNHHFAGERPEFVESREQLAGHLAWPHDDWQGIGKRLGALFSETDGVTIAVTPAGAIPYYSRLRTIDMLGLNDAWVARHGHYEGPFPGHRRKATLKYLIQAGTDFIISHPKLLQRKQVTPGIDKSLGYASCAFYVPIEDLDALHSQSYGESRLVRMPVSDTHDLLMIWLTPTNEVIGRVAQEAGWTLHAIGP